MKKIILFMAIMATILCANCANQQNDASIDEQSQEQEVNMESLVKTTLQVEGMTCTGCEKTIESGLKEIAGIVEVKANHKDSTTYVVFDSTQSSLAVIEEEIAKVGYQVAGNK